MFKRTAHWITASYQQRKGTSFLFILLCFLVFQTPLFAQNPIVLENQKPGNPATEWDISGAGDLTLQGFATDISVNRGQTIRFKIKSANAYTINIYRLGYYGGQGARLVGTGIITATLPQTQPNPLTNATTGIVDCGNWSESAHWDVPADAVSGIYFAKLTRSNGGSSHIVFIVRDDAGQSDILFKTSDATWQAYNAYGGNSFYVGNTSFPGGHAAKISYNRPFITRNGGGGGAAAMDWLFNAEYPMIRWLERNGYSVSYFTCADLARSPNLLNSHKVIISVGHDEYWSGQERTNITNARNAGKHLAFFSGNEVYWKTRWENSTDGSNTPYRTLVCYKEGTSGENVCGSKCDPLANTWTGLWREGCNYPAADGCQPENNLTGEISWVESTNPITVPATYRGYRFWRNTSVASLGSGQTATLSNGVLGYEWDYEQDNGAEPAHRIVLSNTLINGLTHRLSLYRHPGGALVFGAGTVQWSWGLDDKHDRGTSTQDARMQQATMNLFADMGALPGTVQSGLIASQANDAQPPATTIVSPVNGSRVTQGVAVNVSGTSADAGVIVGVEYSVDGGNVWQLANGTTSWNFSWTPPAQGTYTIRTRAYDDLGNLESATTSSNTIQVSTSASNCTPPTAVLSAAAINCTGTTVQLKLTSATGQSPYTAVVNNVQYTGVTVGQPFANVAAEQSIWGNNGSPQVPNDNDGQSIETGVKFRASQSGTISGIRFYKGSGNTGTHTGNLWSSTGTKLASAVFVNETASGWQEVRFTSPVSITANTTYVASCFSAGGGYASSSGYFNTATSSGALTALANGTDGANGVYRYGTGFPGQSFNSSNYWVDVVFKPSGTLTFNLTSLTDAAGCNNSGSVSSVVFNLSDIGGGATYYRDSDGDGLGDSAVTITSCTQPTGYVLVKGDCDDTNPAIKAGSDYFRDNDGDGFGNPAIRVTTCSLPAGYVTNNTDCNDSDATVHPGATEICDGKDNNCNGQIDEQLGTVTYYRDADGDGFGNAAVSVVACVAPVGYVINNTDCNDSDALIKPTAVEICDGKDNNCNGQIDEGCQLNPETSIWGTGGSPQLPNDNDGTAIEVGLKFRSSVAGEVTGVRFYKGSANTGVHTGSLWTATGTKLASATFINETASGWQQVQFATPVAITANTTYVVSYLSPGGGYSSTTGYFTSAAFVNGSLTALRTGTDGVNGIYRYGGGFPTSSYQASNYWVDVLFRPLAATEAQRSSVMEETQQPKFFVVPNPSSNCFTLHWDKTGTEPQRVSVFDGQGRFVEEVRQSGAANLLGCGYAAGVYYVKVNNGKENTYIKFIKL